MGRVDPQVNARDGWGRPGSLTWHERWLLSLENVDDVDQYLSSMSIDPVTSTSLVEAKTEALRLIKEKKEELCL